MVSVRFGLSKLRTYHVLMLLPVFSLFLIGWAMIYAARQPYDGFSWLAATGSVQEIDPNGPAASVGLHIGDTILTADGIPVAEFPSLYRGKRPGDQVVYRVLPQKASNPVEVILELTAPSTEVLLTRLVPLLIALSLWLISVIVLVLRPGLVSVHLFFLVNQVGSIGLSTGLLSTFRLEIGAHLFQLSLSWLSPLLVHFHTLFPERRQTPVRLRLTCIFYIASLALSIMFLVFWRWLRTESILKYLDLYVILRLLFLTGVVVGILFLLRNYWVMPSQGARQRIRLVAFCSVLAFVPLVLLSIFPEVLWGQFEIAYELSFLALLLIPIAYGYALYRHNLFETDRILNRSLVYAILVILWISLYLALAAIIQYFLPRSIPSSMLGGAAIILVMVLAFPDLRKTIQRIVDRLFYGGWYDYQTVVTHFSHALGITLEEGALADLLIVQLPRVMRVRWAGLLLPNSSQVLVPYCANLAARDEVQHRVYLGCEFVSATQVDEKQAASAEYDLKPVVEVLLDGPLANFLRRRSEPIEGERLRRQLADQTEMTTAGEQALLHHPEIQLWAPLVFQGGLEGVLLLGSKMADDLYTDEDYRILNTLAYQIAGAIRNVRLVKELRRRLEEITASQHELQEAHRRLLAGREEERKRLARDIHDGPLQKLIEISYRLRDVRRNTDDPALLGYLQELQQTSLRLLDELRHICTDLRPPALDVLGLAAAMRIYTDETVKASWDVNFTIHGDDRLLSADVSVSLFRIFQEAIANALRHAHATRITAKLDINCGTCSLAVWDDGEGFSVPARLEGLAHRKHFGLLGMRERAAILGGTLEIISTPGSGTQVKVWVPLKSTPLPEEQLSI